MNIWNIENNFYLKSDPARLKKVICQFEIFKQTTNVSGDIVECGVFKGSSLIRFLTFRDLLRQQKKKVVGFDPFGKFPKQKIKEDNKFGISHNKSSGLGINKNILNKYLRRKKFKNFRLIKGDIKKTLPVFLKKEKKMKISFLHLDMDVFEPTKFALDFFYNKISKNGIILIDDYNQVNGATKATKLFLKSKRNLRLEKLNFDDRLNFIIKK